MELGYHVTLVRDATAAFSAEMMHACTLSSIDVYSAWMGGSLQ
jgi:nicotinamidase-related amidase